VTQINRLGNLPSNTQVENTGYVNGYFESVIPYGPRQHFLVRCVDSTSLAAGPVTRMPTVNSAPDRLMNGTRLGTCAFRSSAKADAGLECFPEHRAPWQSTAGILLAAREIVWRAYSSTRLRVPC